jgi:hypothetical protein
VGLQRRGGAPSEDVGRVDGLPYVGRGTCISTPMPRNFSRAFSGRLGGRPTLPDALSCRDERGGGMRIRADTACSIAWEPAF